MRDIQEQIKLSSKWFMVLVLICVFGFVRQMTGEVKTVDFFSESIDRTMRYNIFLPENYNTSTKNYPVLYLLHGLTSDYWAWVRYGAPQYATNYDLILVMPDAGNSWYVNWAKSEEGQKNNFRRKGAYLKHDRGPAGDKKRRQGQDCLPAEHHYCFNRWNSKGERPGG